MILLKKIIIGISLLFICTCTFAEKVIYPPKQIRCIKVSERNAWQMYQCENLDHMFFLEASPGRMPFNVFMNFTFIGATSSINDGWEQVMLYYKSPLGVSFTLRGSFYEIAKISDSHWKEDGYDQYQCTDPEAQCPITNLPF